jgi:hypothetical protein
MEQVDVVELERAVVRAAETFHSVTRDALKQPKVRMLIGDAREVLLSTPQHYDIVFSEPSNPYRAGVASMFTQEYYRAIQARLNPNGLFLQWVQGYDVNRDTIRTIYATLLSVFPNVETWQLQTGDLLLLGAERPHPIAVDALRTRLAEPVFREGIAAVWRATDVEGVLARYVGGSKTSRRLAASYEDRINTDDRTLVEFSFARSLRTTGRTDFTIEDMRDLARRLQDDRPPTESGTIDWDRVEYERTSIYAADGEAGRISPQAPAAVKQASMPLMKFLGGDSAGALQGWHSRNDQPLTLSERVLMAHAFADRGDALALPLIEGIRSVQPIEADVLLARLLLRQDRLQEAGETLEGALVRYRTDPWPGMWVMRGAMDLVHQIAARNQSWSVRMTNALSEPFALYLFDDARLELLVQLKAGLPLDSTCVERLAPLEPHFSWQVKMLRYRAACYKRFRPELAARAGEDLQEILVQRPPPLEEALAR